MNATYTLQQLALSPNADAANESFPRQPPVLTKARATSSGWDPFEVWRTRVYLEQRRLGFTPWDDSKYR
jgi:hypothetical protein